jgi:hypothetical protein
MEKGFKHLLYLFILLCLALPFIQYKKNLRLIAPLKSESEVFQKPNFSFSDLKSGAFQEKYNSYVDHNFGIRPFLIRLLNQIKFFLFHQSDAPGVVVGKYNYLYLSSYTTNYMGTNFIGHEKVKENVQKLKQLQDSLKKLNVDLVVVFASGKASYYPEFLPNYMSRQKRETNNLSAYAASFQSAGINFINLNSWFLSLKKNARYALYPELGVHLTPHGTFLTADTISRYIEKLRNIDLPDVVKYKIDLKDSLREQEHDVEELMNLRKPLFHQPAPYFQLSVEKNDTQVKPNVLAIGDSYWWQLTGLNLPAQFFKEDVFWYYNNSVFINNNKQEYVCSSLNYGDELLSRDVVVIMASEATYDLFPFGFLDKAYPVFCMTNAQKADWLKERIKTNKDWYENIKKKAIENKLKEEEQMAKDIQYVINTELTAFFTPQSYIDSVVNLYPEIIKNNPSWFAAVQKKASEKNISVADQLHQDAQYAYSMDYETEEAKLKLKSIKSEIRQDQKRLNSIADFAHSKNISFQEAFAWEVKSIYDEQVKK